jgi:hypothetical protein
MNSWEEFFANVTYKPGFTFEYENMIDFNREKVTLTMRVPDSRDLENLKHPSEVKVGWGAEARRIPLIPVVMTNMLPPWTTVQVAKDYLRYLINSLEQHEVDEWFRYDGELVFDPHADQAAFDRAG